MSIAGSEGIKEDVVILGAGSEWLLSSVDWRTISCRVAFEFVVGSAEVAGGDGGSDGAGGAGGAGEGSG